jgi:WD40 repeat protein
VAATYTLDHPPRPATVTLWDTVTGQPRRRLATGLRLPGVAAFSPDGRRLALGLPAFYNLARAQIEVWDLRSDTRAAALDIPASQDRTFSRLEFSPDGSLLIIPGYNGSHRYAWDVTQTPPQPIDLAGGPLELGDQRVWAPAYPLFAPDGARFVGPGPEPNTLAFRETAAPRHVVLVAQTVRPIGRPEFSPDGQTLAVLHTVPTSELLEGSAELGQSATGPAAPVRPRAAL